VLYFSGNPMPLLSYLKELPFTAVSFEEDRKNYGIDLGEIRRVLGPDRVLLGNVNASFLEKASEPEILEEVKRQIHLAGRRGNFIVSTGSPVTPGTSLERLRFFLQSTQRL
jgi:uroporphyrinogen-III decarboxylase